MIKPTESELEILNILWKEGPSSVRVINEKMNEQVRDKKNKKRIIEERKIQERLIQQQREALLMKSIALLERNKAITEEIETRELQFKLMELNALQGDLIQEISKIQNQVDQTASLQIEQLKLYRKRYQSLTEEMERLSNIFHSKRGKQRSTIENQKLREAQLEKAIDELNKLNPNRIILPGGEANEGILNVMLQPFVDKKSSTVYILDGIVLTDPDLLEKNIERLRSIEIVSDNTDVIKDFFGRDLEGKSTIIKLSTKTQGSAPRARFKLNDQFEIESIIIDNQELKGEEREKALMEYRRYRELKYLERERVKLNTIIQSYENQGINKPEIQAQLKEAYGKVDLLSERISATRQFIRANNQLPKNKYESVTIGQKMDSLSINHIMGNPTQSVFYLKGENRKKHFDVLVDQFKQSPKVTIEVDGKLKKNWTLKDLSQKLDIDKIEKLAFVKGETMYNFHSKKKLGESTALLRVSTKD